MKVKIFNKNLWKDYLAILGTIGVFTGFLTIFITIKDENKLLLGIIFLILTIVVFLILLYRANHTDKIRLSINRLEVNILYGDLFNSVGLKLIPFNEYFDTLVDNVVIAESTLNGMFIKRYYSNLANFDNQITSALTNITSENNSSRIMGKTHKYKLGTTIEVANGYLLTAFTHFDDANRATLTKGEYLLCLDNLWNEIDRVYAQRNINIPLLGAGISRIGNELKPQDYLEQILNSLKFSNIDLAYNTKLNIVLHESVKEEINLFEIKYKY